MKKFSSNIFVSFLYLILFSLAIILILCFNYKPKKNGTERVAFITNGNLSDEGWNNVNYQGISTACENVGMELVPCFDVNEYDGSCTKVVEELVDDGVGMIILDSHAYAEELQGVLDKYPGTVFYGASPDLYASNLTSFSSRLYQARYLSGVIAGMETKTNKIGFVAADWSDHTIIRGLDAFALGVRSVNPEAEVIVAWSGSWDNEQREKQLARDLIEKEKADIITYHQNKPYVVEVAEELGVKYISYYEKLKGASELQLTCAFCDWEPIYEDMLQSYLKGMGNSVKSDWLGLRSGAIGLTEFSPLVKKETVDAVNSARTRIESGIDVFTGVIRDNEGKLRCDEGQSITDDYILHKIDWLVEGVREYEE